MTETRSWGTLHPVPSPASPPYAARSAGGAAVPPWWAPALRDDEDAGTPPVWAEDIESAVARTASVPGRCANTWSDAFAAVLAPLAHLATERLAAVVAREVRLRSSALDPAAVLSSFRGALDRRLVRLATPVLVRELHRWRERGTLSGADGPARFADFVRRHTEPGPLAELFVGYPVLARLLAQECARAVEAVTELLVRFHADRERIVATLLDTDPGPVVAVLTGRGDPHRGGRSTSVLEFADGARVVYQPRGVAALRGFAELVGLLNRLVPDLGLATVAAVDGDGHGWTAFVRHAPLAEPARATTFFRRLGALLALLHVTRATDIHYDNLIARDDQPFLVDLETLFHPGPAGPADPAGAALARSVARTALLPSATGRIGLTDVSGVGGDAGQAMPDDVTDWLDPGTDRMRPARRPGHLRGGANRPVCGGRPVDAADHAPALLSGFRDAYDALARHRAEFAVALRRFAGTPVRVVLRPTRRYAALLRAAARPESLRAAPDRDEVLHGVADRRADPLCSRLARYEVADLWVGDIPLFTTAPDSRDVWTAHGVRVDRALARTGLDDALATLAGLDEADRRRQEWVITAALASRRPIGDHHAPAAAVPATGTAAGSDRLLAAACSIGDRLLAEAAGRHRVNWLGLEPVDDEAWLVLPMGAGLADGYCGVALFLAELSSVSGVPRYAEVARQALAAVPDLLAGIAERPDLVTAVGSGALHGFGGIGYALARLATRLGDDEVGSWARSAVGLAAQAENAEGSYGWADGTAGCAAAMAAVSAELGFAEAGRLARRCVARLGRAPEPDEAGFANGAAGIRHAVAVVTGVRPARPSASPAPTEPGWCRGAAGAVVGTPETDLDHAVATLTASPVCGDLSLCHGELGRSDVLAALGPNTGTGPVPAALRQRASLVLDVLRRAGPRCATPDGVGTAGLLRGLSGIGYGLLRLGFPGQVPSVLLLEPTPTVLR